MDDPTEVTLLRMGDAAKALGISRSKAYQLVQAGEIPSIRMGGSVRVPARALAAWIESRTRVPAA